MPAHSPDRSRSHWWPIGLLFCATLLNYVDRQTLSVLSATLRRELPLTESEYARVVSAFLIAYGVMYAVGGRWVDRVGVRFGVAACLAWWSIAGMLTSLAQGARSLALCRFLLGVGEPVIYPAGLKAASELFDSRHRGLAMGILSSGSSVGAIIAPPLIAAITLGFGWRAAFLIPGAAGLLLAALWWWTAKPVATAVVSAPVPLRTVLANRDVWALVIPRLFSDPVWYFYLFWMPDYLQRVRGLDLREIGTYGWIPFLAADIGAVGGGALSGWLIARGWEAVAARRAVLTGIAFLAPFGALAAFTSTTAGAIACMCVAACMTQVWSINIATLGAEVMTPAESASILGLMGAAGSLSGAVFSWILGFIIEVHGYPAAFLLAGALHPVAAALLNLLLRRRRPTVASAP